MRQFLSLARPSPFAQHVSKERAAWTRIPVLLCRAPLLSFGEEAYRVLGRRAMAHDRMFHVIVLGGMGLVACGGSLASTDEMSADAKSDQFPSEGLNYAGDAFPPTEGPSVVDALPTEESSTVDSFPTGAPNPRRIPGGRLPRRGPQGRIDHRRRFDGPGLARRTFPGCPGRFSNRGADAGRAVLSVRGTSSS